MAQVNILWPGPVRKAMFVICTMRWICIAQVSEISQVEDTEHLMYVMIYKPTGCVSVAIASMAYWWNALSS